MAEKRSNNARNRWLLSQRVGRKKGGKGGEIEKNEKSATNIENLFPPVPETSVIGDNEIS